MMVATRHHSTLVGCVVILSLLSQVLSATDEHGTNANLTEVVEEAHDETHGEHHGGHHEEPAYAVLFPPLTLTIGFAAFFLLSRYARALPYTAVMFLIGTLTGIASVLSGSYSHISETLRMWLAINWEVLLLTFLPVLIFKDAYGLNVHLFVFSLGQQLIFAFPLVLAGTVLGALIGFYIFPWGWSFNFAMTVGSILAATDPVAVAALLEEVGAPPRLKVHIAGESLLNDGSAIVFFSIFSERYFGELEIPGFGEEIDVGKGIALFCKKSIGGAAAGLLFGIGLLGCLFLLNRRFSREENVVQVATITGIIYLNYYVSDFVWKTSGVIASVSAGIVVKLFGRALVNDPKLLDDFLSILEHILNTLLFTLGGAVWGYVIASGEQSEIWTATEWGYLIVLYLLLNVIRLVQFVSIYPITVRIGLKTNWQETAFQIFGGLRGALGITLAIALDNRVSQATGGRDETIHEIHTQQAFACIGGVAFMTLTVNSIFAGPFLRKLGLADSSEARRRIVKSYNLRFRSQLINEMVVLLCQDRFRHVSFAHVKRFVPALTDLTRLQLLQAVAENKDTTNAEEYRPPHLQNILPDLIDDSAGPHNEEIRKLEQDLLLAREVHERNARLAKRAKERKSRRAKGFGSSTLHVMMKEDPLSTMELRVLFISILKTTYEFQIEHGELEGSHLLAVLLDQSLDLALAKVSNGESLRDWEILQDIHQPLIDLHTKILGKKMIMNMMPAKIKHRSRNSNSNDRVIDSALCVMAAHERAQIAFAAELQDADSELADVAKIVIGESEIQYNLAQNSLKAFDKQVLEGAISNKFCRILLNLGIGHIEEMVALGMMKETEAEPLIEEIEEHLYEINENNDHASFREESGGSDVIEEGTSDVIEEGASYDIGNNAANKPGVDA